MSMLHAQISSVLPGAAPEHYVKLNTAVALMLMPVLGGLMVVFLPFIGLYLAAKTAVSGVSFRGSRAVDGHAGSVG